MAGVSFLHANGLFNNFTGGSSSVLMHTKCSALEGIEIEIDFVLTMLVRVIFM